MVPPAMVVEWVDSTLCDGARQSVCDHDSGSPLHSGATPGCALTLNTSGIPEGWRSGPDTIVVR